MIETRSWLILVIGFWLAAGCAGSGEEAQVRDPEAVVGELERVWNSQDGEAVPALFAADAVFRDVAFGVERRGLAEIRAMFRETWQGIPDLHTEITRILPHGDWVTSEWTLTGTHSGDFPDLPATGRSFTVQGVSVIHVRDGKIVSQRDYYDRASFLEQLGVSTREGTRSEGEEVREPLVRGIGGVFFKAEGPEDLQEWYRRHLGFEPGQQGQGVDFLWRRHEEPSRVDRTVWSLFPRDTDYFGSSGQRFMVNYIVDDLDRVLSRLAESDIHPVKDPEEYPYGRFAWVQDGEGNRIELWEPPGDEGR